MAKSRRPPRCPKCRAERTVKILYGFPGAETIEKVERGEIPRAAIGGCLISPHNPTWVCPDCEHRWR